MPALGMAQETGKLIAWLKKEGDEVSKGEPLMEIETDKATVEIDAPADGLLSNVIAQEGDDVPVGQAVGLILASGEKAPEMPIVDVVPPKAQAATPKVQASGASKVEQSARRGKPVSPGHPSSNGKTFANVSPLAMRMAQEHQMDLSQLVSKDGNIRKADVVAYLRDGPLEGFSMLSPASPKARLMAQERELLIETIAGSGPEGAVLAVDVESVGRQPESPMAAGKVQTLSNAWRIMAERMTQSWTQVPHFFLLRQVDVSEFAIWLESALKESEEKITYTDLLVKVVAEALRKHPNVNASWSNNAIRVFDDINVGIAVATKEALVVPVIHESDRLSLMEIASQRRQLVEAAQKGRLKLDQIQGGTFTISNLGMYKVDAFNAIVNSPQAATLAIGRVSDQVVAVEGKPVVRPMMNLSLSSDHRVIDGARAAQFLDTLASNIEAPNAEHS